MLRTLYDKKIHYTLRVASAMCFIGHGCFGILTKSVWCNYYALLGIGRNTAYHLMPITGWIDIMLGIILLVKPVRIIAVWLVLWGVLTALCRPLAGEPMAEFFERAANFGAPLALLLWAGDLSLNGRFLFSAVDPQAPITEKSLRQVTYTLRLVVFFLLAGHGWLNLLHKPALLAQYASLGIHHPQRLTSLLGIVEILAALTALLKPVRSLILLFLFWKLASELFYPQFEILEWVERGGSYGCLLALWFCLAPQYSLQPSSQAKRQFVFRWPLVLLKEKKGAITST